MRNKFIKIFLLCLLAQSVIIPTFAQDTNPFRKLVRGGANMVLSPFELFFRQPILTAREEGDFSGATWGYVKGIGFMFGRLGLGAYETVTFLVPPYRVLVKPEFVFSDEENN